MANDFQPSNSGDFKFACTKNECPREVIRRRRHFSVEKCKFQEREERGREIRERKRLLAELQHQEKVDYLQRRPCEEAPQAVDVDASEKQKAKVAHTKLVLWRKKQLEQQRQSQLQLEKKLKDELHGGKKVSARKSRLKNDDCHIREVQENKAQQLREHQKTAAIGSGYKSQMAELRLDEMWKAKQAACDALKKQKQTAVQRVLQKHQQINQKAAEVVATEIQVKNQRADYVLGIEPKPPVKCLFKPRPKKVPPPFIPPKYVLAEKTYNLEFLRLKFKSDEALWHRRNRRNRDIPLPTLDAIVLEWKQRSRFEDPDVQFGEVQKEFANAEETLRLEQCYSWISAPVSVQVLRQVCLASLVPSEQEYAALGVLEKIALNEKMREKQVAAVEEEIERRVRRQQAAQALGVAEKLAQLERGVGANEGNDNGGGTKFDYATMLYKNVLRRWDK
ncbi:Hypothetical predicted protein [Cloeon dipterum]|uniref:Uncharacterized protein n=1 Tax=Cloeon dipterum TaxID=197152 RepID=A0A8S1CK64_9INSE|nr:Hypothetical predicted protein [Cloeon dipterum]